MYTWKYKISYSCNTLKKAKSFCSDGVEKRRDGSQFLDGDTILKNILKKIECILIFLFYLRLNDFLSIGGS